MKNIGKSLIVALLSVHVLIVPIIASAASEDSLAPSSWAAADVSYMIKSGVVPAELQGNYQSDITRSEFASLASAVLAELINDQDKLNRVIFENRFDDTTNQDVYTAYKFGIVNGVSAQIFQPDRSIDRKEAVVMMGNMMRTLKLEGAASTKAPYIDYSVIPGWAKDSADITYNAKIFSGSAAGLEPDKAYTREQSIVTMKRLMDFAKNVKGVSLRGKVYVAADSIFDVRVGTNYVKIGSDKSPKTVNELWATVSNNFPGVSLNGEFPERLESDGFLIETLGEDYQIKISW